LGIPTLQNIFIYQPDIEYVNNALIIGRKSISKTETTGLSLLFFYFNRYNLPLNPDFALGVRTETYEAEAFSTQKAKGMVIPFTRLLRKKMSGIVRRIPRPNANSGLNPQAYPKSVKVRNEPSFVYAKQAKIEISSRKNYILSRDNGIYEG